MNVCQRNVCLSWNTEVSAIFSASLDATSESVDVLSILKEWSTRSDAPLVVRESCVVAVDMWEVSQHVIP